MPFPPELLTFAPAALAALAILRVAALVVAGRRATAPAAALAAAPMQRRGGSGPEHRARDWACVCLPDTSFHPFYDASR